MWFEMWYQDKQSMLETMIRNMASDLANGYTYFGSSITKQRADIDAYKANMDAEYAMLMDMDDKKAERWCRMDLIRRGAIEL